VRKRALSLDYDEVRLHNYSNRRASFQLPATTNRLNVQCIMNTSPIKIGIDPFRSVPLRDAPSTWGKEEFPQVGAAQNCMQHYYSISADFSKLAKNVLATIECFIYATFSYSSQLGDCLRTLCRQNTIYMVVYCRAQAHCSL
jgi:hypothetical protein